MSAPTVAIVCTTIGDGSFLKHYAQAITEADARDRVTMIVIPDRKTPAALYEAAAEARAAGISVDCPDLGEQERFLASLGAPAGMFPWDTDHRRNIGYLMAWRDGADIMVSVDDDNLPGEGWLNGHAVVAEGPADRPVADAGALFWTPCSQLEFEQRGVQFWPRGFPYSRRARAKPLIRNERTADCDVSLNAGLWLGNPDVDAITRLTLEPLAGALKNSAVLAPRAWAPVNSQNTAIRREVIPAYYFFRSGRFGDIYQGYLAQACAKAMGHAVRFGTPAVTHARNDHDLLHDLQLELPDILLLDDWLDWLTSLKHGGRSYAEVYAGLAEAMLDLHNPVFPSMGMQMRSWLKLVNAIGA